jgi:peptide/nickel transport system substrate-binding protein
VNINRQTSPYFHRPINPRWSTLSAWSRRAVAGGVAGALVAALGACAASPSQPAAGAKTTLRFSQAQEPPNWDFLTSPAAAIRAVVALNVVESLLDQDRQGNLRPLLASSYTVSPDRREYVFTIRAAKFHDGSALTAADVVYSLEHNRKSPLVKTNLPFAQVKSIEAVGADKVKVTLKRPSNAFLTGMAANAGLIIKKDGAAGLAQHPIGTGPFAFAEWHRGVDVVLRRFAGYWGKAPALTSVNVRFIAKETAALSQLRAGQLDLMSGSDFEQINALRAQGRFTVVQLSAFGTNYLALNAKDPAFRDIRVRQAVAAAVDRTAINNGVFGGKRPPTCGWVWDAQRDPITNCPYPHDPAKARQLLQAAHEPALQLKLKFHVGLPFYQQEADIIVSDLKQAGVTVAPVARDMPTFFKEILQTQPPRYQVTILSGGEPLNNWRCPTGWFLNYCDKEFDRTLDAADAAPTLAEYKQLSAQANERLMQAAYLIPLTVVNVAQVMDSGVRGVQDWPNAQSSFDLRGIRWS